MQEAKGISVIVLTYKHSKYIGQCLEGICAQQYKGPLQVLVADDASPDDTLAQVQAYAKKDGRIEVLAQATNLGVAHNFEAALKRCIHPYIAFCEGDDYWTDPDKIRAQAALLDARPEVSMVYTNYARVNGHGEVHSHSSLGEQVAQFGLEDLLFSNGPSTNTVMVRREALPSTFPTAFYTVPNPDVFLFAWALIHGKCAYIDKVCSAYRLHEDGVWSSRSALEQKLIRLSTRLQVLKSLKAPVTNLFQERLQAELLLYLGNNGIDNPLLFSKFSPFLSPTQRFNLRWKHAWIRLRKKYNS